MDRSCRGGIAASSRVGLAFGTLGGGCVRTGILPARRLDYRKRPSRYGYRPPRPARPQRTTSYRMSFHQSCLLPQDPWAAMAGSVAGSLARVKAEWERGAGSGEGGRGEWGAEFQIIDHSSHSPLPTPHSLPLAFAIALIESQRRLERGLGNLPDRLLFGVGVAMGDQKAVHELEEVPGHRQGAKGGLQPPRV